MTNPTPGAPEFELRAEPQKVKFSTLEGLRLLCSLTNHSSDASEIPTPFDRSGSLNVLLSEGRKPVRAMNRLTRQSALNGGRVDSSLDVDVLPAGEAWTWNMDMASFHYGIPPSDYILSTHYDYEPQGISIKDGPYRLRVLDTPLLQLQEIRDNPILDGLTLLFSAYGESGTEYYLHLYNPGRPVGPWWAVRILEGVPAENPFCASANFFQTESTDEFHRKWIVWTQDGQVCAQCYLRGAAVASPVAAPIPEGCHLIRSAVRTRENELWLFFRNSGGELEAHRFHESTLQRIFAHRARWTEGEPVAIVGDETSFHVATSWRGIIYDHVAQNGRLIDRFHVLRTRLRPVSFTFDAAVLRLRAAFRDNPNGKVLQLAVVDIPADSVVSATFNGLPVRGHMMETAFDRDSAGRIHILFSTSADKLLYYSEGRGPVLVCEGEGPFFPVVVGGAAPYLGSYRGSLGYRFVRYIPKRRGRKFVGEEPHG